MSSGSRRNKDAKGSTTRKNPKRNEHVAAPKDDPVSGISPEKVPDEKQRLAVESLLHGRSTRDGMRYKKPGNNDHGAGGNPEHNVTGNRPLVDKRPPTANESDAHDQNKYGGRKRN